MNIQLNGQAVILTDSTDPISLQQALDHWQQQSLVRPPFAVMLNGDFTPKSTYVDIQLKENDRVEILGAIQGG